MSIVSAQFAMAISSSTFACCLYLNHIPPFRIYYTPITSTMPSNVVVHNPSRDNSVFQFEDKSVVLTTDNEAISYGGDIIVIFTNRDLPIESVSQEDGPRTIYANRHEVQDSNGEVEEVILWPGRHISSILIHMLDIRVASEKRIMENFHAAVESFCSQLH